MNIKKLAMSAAACLAFAGCDKIMDGLPLIKEKRAIEKAVVEDQKPEVEAAPGPKVNMELQSFRQHVESTERILAAEIAAASGRVAAVQTDSDALAKAMSAAAGKLSDGQPVGRKDALISLLRNDAVNALARRYLSRSFSLVALEVEQRVGEAEEAERQRRKEQAATIAETKAAVEQARAESRRATESALEGQRKLKRELEDLRRRKKRLENEINMVAASGRGMKRHEINMLNNEILRMEREYDGLRVSRAVSRDVQVSEEKARQAQLSADSRRTRANYEFDKTVSAVSSAEVVSGFEDGTVLALEKAIADSLSSAAARRDRIARAADYVKAKGDVKNSISSSTLQESKADIDAYVAAALKDPK